jgi:hypothetical protein
MNPLQKFKEARPFADPAKAADKLIEIAKGLRIDKGRMPVGEWNDVFRRAGGSVAEYAAGRDHAIAAGIITMHESGSIFMWTAPQAGDDLPGTIEPTEA